jgi:2'-5' RNA ligase
MQEPSVSEIYESMWQNSIKGFNHNQFEYDYFLNHFDEDSRRGISLIGRLKGEVLTKEETLGSLKSFKISFRGITASPSCVMIQGFPLDDNLAILRDRLRDSFRASNLVHSMDKRYTLKTAHSTVIRFKRPLHNNRNFIDFLNQYRDYNFGSVEMNSIDFVYNNWFMTNSIVKTINSYKLSSAD